MRVIEQFESGEPSSFGHHSGGTSGREFFTQQAGFECHLSTRSEEWITLMSPLVKDDVPKPLLANGHRFSVQAEIPRRDFILNPNSAQASER